MQMAKNKNKDFNTEINDGEDNAPDLDSFAVVFREDGFGVAIEKFNIDYKTAHRLARQVFKAEGLNDEEVLQKMTEAMLSYELENISGEVGVARTDRIIEVLNKLNLQSKGAEFKIKNYSGTGETKVRLVINKKEWVSVDGKGLHVPSMDYIRQEIERSGANKRHGMCGEDGCALLNAANKTLEGSIAMGDSNRVTDNKDGLLSESNKEVSADLGESESAGGAQIDGSDNESLTPNY